jgi:hypothetical protein
VSAIQHKNNYLVRHPKAKRKVSLKEFSEVYELVNSFGECKVKSYFFGEVLEITS